jgi:predicted HicB family RNase H-like nuclease
MPRLASCSNYASDYWQCCQQHDPAQISAALRDVQQRYEADAERQLQEMKIVLQREAVTDVLTLQREQLEQEANKGSGERAAKLREALAHAIGLAPAEQAEALNQLVQEQDEAAVDESQRREVVRAVYQSLQQAGFVVDGQSISHHKGR